MTKHPPLDDAIVRSLTVDTEPWLSCDDCFEQVDVWVDALLFAGGSLSPEFRAHLRGCAACHEEARSLTALVASTAGLDPGLALVGFDKEVGP